MKQTQPLTPDTATGRITLAGTETVRPLGTKRDVANLAQMRSVRWVNDQIYRGMPCLRLGPRRTRFDLEEVRQWLKDKYGQQRIGPAHAITTK